MRQSLSFPTPGSAPPLAPIGLFSVSGEETIDDLLGLVPVLSTVFLGSSRVGAGVRILCRMQTTHYPVVSGHWAASTPVWL